MFDLVVFDMAGTTVYDDINAVNASFRAALKAAGIEADPEFVKTVMGLPKPEAVRILLERYPGGRSGSPAQAEIDAIHEDFVKRMCNYYRTEPAVREIPGAASVFSRLRAAGIKIALNTGFSRAVADVLLARLGWRELGLIDADIASDEVTNGRPQPDMIRALMQRLEVRDVRRVVKVGDTRSDLEEGTNAGCGLVIGVTTGAYTREQLLTYPHSHIVESVREVPILVLPGVG